MGMTFVQVQVANPANPERTEPVDLMVDSGAMYSVVPAPVLEKLGIRPLTEQVFQLANGDRITRKKGVAVFKYAERIGGADVVFGEEGDVNLLGVGTLESLGLLLDPLKRELRELPLMLADLDPSV